MDNYCIPIHIKDYNIYDVLYNDNGEFVIVTPGITESFVPSVQLKIQYEDNVFDCFMCSYNYTNIYKLKANYKENITLTIDGNIINTRVNKYPEFPNEMLFTTEIKDFDDYIIRWIDFHKRLGISRFIIYDNSDNNNLGTILNQYILDKIVILIKWKYPLFTHEKRSGQTTQQNHCINAFQTSKYIGLFDVDEYVNIQRPLKLQVFFEKIILEKNIDTTTISGFEFLNKFFHNPGNNQPTDGNNLFNIFTCETIRRGGHQKLFVIPKNVKAVCVHVVSNGLPIYNLDPHDGYFNHYFFLNRIDRGRDNCSLTDKSILIHLPTPNN